MGSLLIIMLVAFGSSLLLTPMVRRLARRFGLVDKPDRDRKLHDRGTPLGGGLAIFASATFALGLVVLWPTILSIVDMDHLIPKAMIYDHPPAVWEQMDVKHSAVLESTIKRPGLALTSRTAGLLLASLVICTVGLIDDRWGLRGRQKLLGQAMAVSILMAYGLMIQNIRIFEWEFQLGFLAIPFTLFWMLGAINAVNLIDGADGMATTVGIILSLTIAVMAMLFGNPLEASIAIALAGALLGFLLFNFPPASIFLGDAGSMLIGLVLGALAIRSALKGPTTVAMAAPLAIMAVPIFDSSVAVLRRWLTGRSIYQTDRGHLHHCLMRTGLSNRRMLLTVAVLCGGTATAALVSVYLRNEILALFGAAMVLGCLVAARVFGHAELKLLTTQALAFGGSFVPLQHRRGSKFRQHAVQLQGSRNWHEVWETLTDFAVRHELCKIRLDLNLSWLHEGYHASWQRKEMPDSSEQWMTRFPVVVNGRRLGRLEIAGPVSTDSIYQLLSLMAELLDSMQPALERLAAEAPAETNRDKALVKQLQIQAPTAKA